MLLTFQQEATARRQSAGLRHDQPAVPPPRRHFYDSQWAKSVCQTFRRMGEEDHWTPGRQSWRECQLVKTAAGACSPMELAGGAQASLLI